MESRFTLAPLQASLKAQVGITRFGVIQRVMKTVGVLCLATGLSGLGLAGESTLLAQSASQSGNATPRLNPAPPSVRRPDLELGRQGGAVAELQGVLKLLGFYQGDVNGRYNEATSLAVVRFQAAAKLPQTGRVSTNTWNALFPLDTPSPAVAAAPMPAPRTPVPAAPAPAAPKPSPAPTATPTVSAPAPAAPAASQPAPPKPTAASKPAAAPKPNPYPTLKLGEEGDAVARLQRQLGRKGFLEGQPDGAFGPMTEEAVKAAQEALGLEVDGVVGPATWRALLK